MTEQKINPELEFIPSRNSLSPFATEGSQPIVIGNQVIINERTYAAFSRKDKIYCLTQYDAPASCKTCIESGNCHFFNTKLGV